MNGYIVLTMDWQPELFRPFRQMQQFACRFRRKTNQTEAKANTNLHE